MTFATGAGSDSAGCGAVTSPCRTLQQAVTNTPAGGYVVLQGPADFGPWLIDKSVSIVGEGGATIRATDVGDGRYPIAVAGQANTVVRLRGLTIEGAGVGYSGVVWIGGARLEIADCIIRNFRDHGVYAQPDLPRFSTYRSFVAVIDTVAENNRTGLVALKASQSRIGLSVFVEGLRAQHNQYGTGWQYFPPGPTYDAETLRAVVTKSAATDNAQTGYSATLINPFDGPLPAGSGVFVVGSTASGSAAGAQSGTTSNFEQADGALSFRNAVITGNAAANGGTKLAHSYGGNVIRGNADDTPGGFASQPLH